jgi:hypothetical protein
LPHVLWIGGAPTAGKSSIARFLAARHGLQLYDFDAHQEEHAERRGRQPARFPAFAAFHGLSLDQRWLSLSSTETAERVIAMWTERFPLVVANLLDLPTDTPIIAEGAGLFPDCVAPILSSPHQAIWLIPTADHCRQVRLSRDDGLFADSNDPQRALHNLIARDILVAGHIRRRVDDLGLCSVLVDGSRPIDDIAAVVERHLLPGFTPRAP